MANRLAKLIRIDTCGGKTRVVAMGLRNPWRVDRDPETGLVYVAGVGQRTWEEISVYSAGTSGLENFGWSRYEGDHLFKSAIDLYPGTTYVPPIQEYEQASGRCSITGGGVHRNGRIAERTGATSTVTSARAKSGASVTRRRAASPPRGPRPSATDFSLVSFGRGRSGGLYVVNRKASCTASPPASGESLEPRGAKPPIYRWNVRRSAAAALAVLALAGCGEGESSGREAPRTETDAATTTAPEGPRSLRLQRIARDLKAPVHVMAAPGEPERLYVVEQEGRIRVVEAGRVRGEPFLDIADQVSCCGEQGLLSVAFHPDYAANRLFYVNYTNREGDTRVVEHRAADDGSAVAGGSARELLEVDQPYPNHNGGQLAFGPDGLLYVGMGDGGSGGDPENRAQDLGERLGKLLRLDVDAPQSDPEVFGYGVRNPWRFSFDRETGDLWLGDVGQGSWEEVDQVRADLAGRPFNFGWDVFEGRARYEDKEPNATGRLVEPVHVYPLEGGNCSVVGGFVYRGEAAPALQGRYFFGDYCAGTIWSLAIRGGRAAGLRREPLTIEGLTSFGEDGQGELYAVSHSGELLQLTGAP